MPDAETQPQLDIRIPCRGTMTFPVHGRTDNNVASATLVLHNFMAYKVHLEITEERTVDALIAALENVRTTLKVNRKQLRGDFTPSTRAADEIKRRKKKRPEGERRKVKTGSGTKPNRRS